MDTFIRPGGRNDKTAKMEKLFLEWHTVQ